jgi:hypothetical protein
VQVLAPNSGRAGALVRGACLILAMALSTPGCEASTAGESHALKTALALAEGRALDTRVEPERLVTPEGWRAALGRSFARHAPRLGGRAYTLTTTFSLAVTGAPRMETTERRTAEITLNGDAHVDHRIAWLLPDDQGEGGRRCWRVGGRLYHARRTGPASLFEERGGEGDRCLDAAIEPLQTLLRALAPRTRISTVPGDAVDGRETVAVSLDPEPDPGAVPTALPAFWQPADPRLGRDGTDETSGVPGPRGPLFLSHGVLRALAGTLTLDAKTGLPLSARLEARLAVQKGGSGGELVVRVECTSTPHRGSITPPEAALSSGPRPRPFLERARLLGEGTKGAPAALPKPGDAPPLRVSPGAEGDPPPDLPEDVPGTGPPP